jgi:hypothetical protein
VGRIKNSYLVTAPRHEPDVQPCHLWQPVAPACRTSVDLRLQLTLWLLRSGTGVADVSSCAAASGRPQTAAPSRGDGRQQPKARPRRSGRDLTVLELAVSRRHARCTGGRWLVRGRPRLDQRNLH